MSRTTDIQLARIQADINSENARANRDIAILQNDTNLRVAQLQSKTQYQVQMLQTLGNAFSQGMQSYFQIRAEERKQEKENQQWAASFQMLLNKDARETAEHGTRMEMLKTELRDKQLETLSTRVYSTYLSDLSSAVNSDNGEAITGVLAEWSHAASNPVALPDGTTGVVPVSGKILEAKNNLLAVARDNGTWFSSEFLSEAQAARAYGQASGGATGLAHRTTASTLVNLLEQGKSLLEQPVDAPEAREELAARLDTTARTVASGMAEWGAHADVAVEAADALRSGDRVAWQSAYGRLTDDVRRDRTSAGYLRLQSAQRWNMKNDPEYKTLYEREIGRLQTIAETYGVDAKVASDARRYAAYQLLPPSVKKDAAGELLAESGELERLRVAHDMVRRYETESRAGVSGLKATKSNPTSGTVPTGLDLDRVRSDLARIVGRGTPEEAQAEELLETISGQREVLLLAGVGDLTPLDSIPGMLVADGTGGRYLPKGKVAELFSMAEAGALDAQQMAIAKAMYAKAGPRASTLPEGVKAALESKAGEAPAADQSQEVAARLAEAAARAREWGNEQWHIEKVHRDTSGGTAVSGTDPLDYEMSERAKSFRSQPVERSVWRSRMRDERGIADVPENTALGQAIREVYREHSLGRGVKEALPLESVLPASAGYRWAQKAYAEWKERQPGGRGTLTQFIADPAALDTVTVGRVPGKVVRQQIARALGEAFRTTAMGDNPSYGALIAGAVTEKPVSPRSLKDNAVRHLAETLAELDSATKAGVGAASDGERNASLVKYVTALRAVKTMEAKQDLDTPVTAVDVSAALALVAPSFNYNDMMRRLGRYQQMTGKERSGLTDLDLWSSLLSSPLGSTGGEASAGGVTLGTGMPGDTRAVGQQ